MDSLVRALHTLVPVLWTAAAAAHWTVFLRDDPGAVVWARRLTWAGVVLHLAEILVTAASGRPPLVQPGILVSGMGLAAAVVHLIVERRVGAATIGIFAVGTTAVLATVGAALGDPLAPPPENLPAASASFHVMGAILGYAGLLLAAIFGSLLLAQRRALRERRFGLFWERLPSVELLDAFTWSSLLAATLFLTVTIGLGHVVRFQSENPPGYWEDPKVAATNLLWLLTLVACVARRMRRLRPSVTAVVAIALFGLALVNLTVVNRFSPVHAGPFSVVKTGT